MRPIREIWKWVLEGFSYRLGDLLIAVSVTFVFSLYFTGNFGESSGIAGGAALVENAANTIWYIINRALWHQVPEKDKVTRKLIP